MATQNTNKTIPTQVAVADFLAAVQDEQKRKDSFTLVELMTAHSGYPAVMWGPAIIGFGSYHYKYASGREGDMPLVGFSPRVNSLSLYLSTEFSEREALLSQLGKYKISKACIYVKRLSDINIEVLIKMIRLSVLKPSSC